MTSILETGVTEGTSNKLATDGIEIAAKTGTSSYNQSEYNKDSGSSPILPNIPSAAGWGSTPPTTSTFFPQKDTGGNYPALIAKAMFQHIYASRQPSEFTVPEEIVSCVLDKVALEEYNDILVADSKTPPEQTITEYYKEKKPSQPVSVPGSVYRSRLQISIWKKTTDFRS